MSISNMVLANWNYHPDGDQHL